ncbi:MAG: hypothetical protein EXR99_14545 [Gemmataceae bacterium]|nr:hypothetical protein [Gemmataceae bacterium]
MEIHESAGKSQPGWRPWLAWACWAGLLIIWTIGLLRPEPVQAANRYFSPWAAFFLAKGLHLGIYFFLAAIPWFLHSGHKAAGLLITFLAVHAWATEYLQQWIRFRTGSLTDAGIDWAGILLGYLAGQWFFARSRRAKA